MSFEQELKNELAQLWRNESIQFRGDAIPLNKLVKEADWIGLIKKNAEEKPALSIDDLRDITITGEQFVPKRDKETYLWNIKRAVAKCAIEFGLRNNVIDGELNPLLKELKWRIGEDGNSYSLVKDWAERGPVHGISGKSDDVLGQPMEGGTGRMYTSRHAVNPRTKADQSNDDSGWARKPEAEGGGALADRILASKEKARRDGGRTFGG
jgi:hypothetical protein